MAKSSVPRPKRRKAALAARLDEIKMDLIGVRASVMTTHALLHYRGGVDKEVAINLLRGAILPVESALALVTALESQS